ncbi:ABC transporter ATP-binding protein [Lysinibacillus louembei]|uniref:ABC transporter ATP-binding protein n=1 Tax=Lysinibacillus louembei TaxID=1470088 RepID=A0ABZ0RUI1_9BACI|nr:ABC transporter ATP-binding protein [Lysinibacillus louembei]WPK10856.1 ABC transporter ATP-binding protein [Lysinibacillus louembei]
MTNLLEVNNLNICFRNGKVITQPIRNINFFVQRGEILGIVGESGCGKSVTSMAVMGLLPPKSSEITGGEIIFNEQHIEKMTEKQLQNIRGNDMSMIFQEPMTSLNPVFTIGQQLMEPLKQHKSLTKGQRRERIVEVLKQVGIPRAEQIIDEYPHQLSGGMRQRVMISLALLCEPKLLIADEPTTALDVTIQAQILELLKRIIAETNMSMMLITHDLGVIAEICHRVVVMYAGSVVEEASVEELFDNPLHPYTKGLLKSLPSQNERKSTLYSIAGQVPKPDELGQGCAFANRCEFATERCLTAEPPVFEIDQHKAKCWLLAGGDNDE